jgi:hypothetical protein
MHLPLVRCRCDCHASLLVVCSHKDTFATGDAVLFDATGLVSPGSNAQVPSMDSGVARQVEVAKQKEYVCFFSHGESWFRFAHQCTTDMCVAASDTWRH